MKKIISIVLVLVLILSMTSCAKVKEKVSKKVEEKVNEAAKKARDKVEEKIKEKVKDTIGDKLAENGIDPSIADAIGDSLGDVIKGEVSVEEIAEKYLGDDDVEVEIDKNVEFDKASLSAYENTSFMESLDTNLRDKELIMACKEVLQNSIYTVSDTFYFSWIDEFTGNKEGSTLTKVYLDKARENQNLERLSDVKFKIDSPLEKDYSGFIISSKKDDKTYVHGINSKLGIQYPYIENNVISKKSFDIFMHLDIFNDENEIISAKIMELDGEKVLLYDSKNTKTGSSSKVWYSLKYGYPIMYEFLSSDYNSVGRILDIKVGENVDGLFDKPEGFIWIGKNEESK